MNIIGLLDCIELQNNIEDLRKLGLTEKEIEGFIEFEWEPVIGACLISSLFERGIDDRH